MFRGVVICRKFFSIVFSCGEKRLKNVKKQFLVEVTVPRQHANTCKPNDVRSDEFRKRKLASAFIQNFAENNALVLPGRITNYKNPDLKLSVLPIQNCTQLESATRLSGSKARRLILVW